MARRHSEAEIDTKHTTFHQGFVWAALAVALGTGLSIGAHLAFVLGFGFPVGRGFVSHVQTHGHVQLVGWAGLMIMGISLHFIPRLAGVPLARPYWLGPILWLMVSGLGLHSIGRYVAPYITEQPIFAPVTWLVAISGGLEWSGILLYVQLLIRTFRGVRNANQRPALLSVKPYFAMMITGWVLYACLNLVLLVHMALDSGMVTHPAWNQFAIQSFIGLV